MIEQPPDRTFPSALQYHIRGIYSPDQLKAIRAELKAASNQEELNTVWHKWKDLAWMNTSLERIKKVAQKADDERGDVTQAIHQYIETGPPRFSQLREIYPQIGNVGNCHDDWRQPHPDMRYLAGSWTNDVVKTVFQTLNGQIIYLLRDRIMENQPTDQWLCQKKCKGSFDEDEDALVPWLLQQPGVVEEAFALAEAWWPEVFRELIEDPRAAEELRAAIQPLVWLTIVSPKRKELDIPPGEVGATEATAGRFVWVANTKMCYGCQKSDYHEVFHFWQAHNRSIFPKLSYEALDGRWDVKLIPSRKEYKKAGPGEEFWMGSRPWKTQVPYILTHDLEKETAKAKKDKVQMIWNDAVISILRKLGYKHLGES